MSCTVMSISLQMRGINKWVSESCRNVNISINKWKSGCIVAGHCVGYLHFPGRACVVKWELLLAYMSRLEYCPSVFWLLGVIKLWNILLDTCLLAFIFGRHAIFFKQ